MRKSVVLVSLVVLLTLAFALPGVAAAAGPGECEFGETHKSFALSGFTGQGPNRGGHVPGGHLGAVGFCGLDVDTGS